MIFLQAFLSSVNLPSKKAVAKLNRIGMDVTVVYMFILLVLVSIPAFIERVTGSTELNDTLPLVFLVIYFFMFYYLPLTMVLFLMFTIIAYLGAKLATLLQRKVRFSLAWKMSAYTTTIPFLIYTVVALFFPIDDVFLWLFIVYTLVVLIKIITVYPKVKKRKHPASSRRTRLERKR